MPRTVSELIDSIERERAERGETVPTVTVDGYDIAGGRVQDPSVEDYLREPNYTREPVPEVDPEWYPPLGARIDQQTEPIEVPNPQWTIDPRQGFATTGYEEFTNLTNEQYRRLTRQQMEAMVFDPYGTQKPKEEVRPVGVMPKKTNKLKEWSISARALRRVILNACNNRERYDYKFGAVWDNRYKMFRIWNIKTNNVVCTLKPNQPRSQSVMRYRQSSFYAPMMAGLNGFEDKNLKIVAVSSDRLCIHRGYSSQATERLSASKEAQLGLRRAMYEEAMNEKRRQAEKEAKAKLKGKK